MFNFSLRQCLSPPTSAFCYELWHRIDCFLSLQPSSVIENCLPIELSVKEGARGKTLSVAVGVHSFTCPCLISCVLTLCLISVHNCTRAHSLLNLCPGWAVQMAVCTTVETRNFIRVRSWWLQDITGSFNKCKQWATVASHSKVTEKNRGSSSGESDQDGLITYSSRTKGNIRLWFSVFALVSQARIYHVEWIIKWHKLL